MESMEWMLTHGIFDTFLMIVLGIVGWFIKGLDRTLRNHATQNTVLAQAVNVLATVIAKEYLPRAEYRQDQTTIAEGNERAHSEIRESIQTTHQRLDRLIERGARS